MFEQLLLSNPLKSVPTLAPNSKTKNIFTESEASILFPLELEKLDSIWSGRSWAVLAIVLADTGLRPAEALALRWKGWHSDTQAFLVWESITDGGQPGRLKTARKGVKKKAALVSSRTTSLLNELHGEAGPEAFVFPSTKFVRTRGQPMRTTTMTHHFARALTKAGMEAHGRTLYCLRHTANTGFRTELGDEATRLLMGHTTKPMTELYDHPEDAALIARAVRAAERKNAP